MGAVGFKDFKRPTGSTAPFQFTPVPVLGGVNNPFHGSHADGLHSIPFSGCRAELHAGELILPTRESAMLCAMANRPTQTLNGDNTTQHITVNISGAQNPREIGRDVRDAISGSRPRQRENARQYAQLNRMGNDDF